MPPVIGPGRWLIRLAFLLALAGHAAAPAAETVKVGKEKKQTIGRVNYLGAGDHACYLTIVDERGKEYSEMAVFEICEQDLLGRRVRLGYGMGKVLAPACGGTPDCTKTVNVVLIHAATVIDPAEKPHPTAQSIEAEAQASTAKAIEQFELALRHEKGTAESASMAQAVELYKSAAVQGNAKAQSSLGRLYMNGKGVELDLVRAHVWIALGARGGSAIASGNLSRVEEKMSPDQRNAAARLLADCSARLPLTCP